MKLVIKQFDSTAGLSGHKPASATKAIPNWFRSMPKFTGKDKKFRLFSDSRVNSTVKLCSPFLDSLTLGYTIMLEYDVQVVLEGDKQEFTWKGGGLNFIGVHSAQQIPSEMIPEGFSSQPFKFTNRWSIKTPSGYSLLFTHPLNRADLPFFTLSGLVDSDDYHMPVELPFLIRSDFDGIIPAGTPVAQIIPIKRESWKSEYQEFDNNFTEKTRAVFSSKISRSYKNLFWKRKEYK
jgi:hypothetical protein